MSSLYKSAAGEAEVMKRYREYLERWPIENQQRMIPTKFGETFVLSCGKVDGPPLVLIHGAMGNSAAWMFDTLVWAQHFHVHIVDVIGDAGLSAPTRPSFSDDSYATWLAEIADALQLKRFNLVGESMGGWLTLKFATAYPERVKSATLLCPAGIGGQKNFLAKVWPLLLLGPWGMRKVRELALGKMPKPESLPPAVARFMDFMALLHRHFRPRLLTFPIFSDSDLKRVTMPLFVIAGGKDAFFDNVQTVQRLRACCGHGEIEFREEAGHLLRDRTQPILAFLLRSQARNQTGDG